MRSLGGERTLSIAPGLNPVFLTKRIPPPNHSIHVPISRHGSLGCIVFFSCFTVNVLIGKVGRRKISLANVFLCFEFAL